MEELNDAQKLINIIMRDLGFSRLIELSNYFKISNGSFHGWLKRNSVRTILKYCKKHGIDEGDLNYKLQNYDSYMSTPLSLFEQKIKEPQKSIEQNINEKEKFFFACEKYKITFEDIAAGAKISLEEVEKIKKESIPTRIFGNYDEFLSKCFFKKYQDLMRNRVATAEAKRTLFAETYLMTVKFPKPLFWLIWCCIGFFIFEEKIKGEEVEDFLDILIQNRKNFGDDLATITTSEELIDIVLAKVEDILLKPKIDPVEEFVKQSTKP